MNSRYYNPEWVRFINVDGIVGKRGGLLSNNLFAYCMNNPINMSDPSGYWSIRAILRGVVDFIQGVGAGIGESLTFGQYKSYYIPSNEIAYYGGKIIGNVATGITSSVGADISYTAAFVTAPTGVGAVAFGAAGTVCAGVAISSAANLAGNTMKFSKSVKEQKGKSFRGGKKGDRDNWYGYDDKNFQNWWHRKGKERHNSEAMILKIVKWQRRCLIIGILLADLKLNSGGIYEFRCIEREY